MSAPRFTGALSLGMLVLCVGLVLAGLGGELKWSWSILFSPASPQAAAPVEEVPLPPECTLAAADGLSPLELESWSLRVDAAQSTGLTLPWAHAGAAPAWVTGGGARLPMELRYALHNPSDQGEMARLMLVTEDGDAQVTWKGYATSVERLVIPSPQGSSWSRPKLRVAIFPVILLAGERGELCCSFRQPLQFTESSRCHALLLPPRRQQWASLGTGTLSGQLPPSLQLLLNGNPVSPDASPPVAWPDSGPPGNFTVPLGKEQAALHLELHQVAATAQWELFCLAFPGAAAASLLVLLLPWTRLLSSRWACSVAVVATAGLTVALNAAWQSRVGGPDLTYRYDAGVWRQVFGSCTWIVAPLVAAFAVFLAWPLFSRREGLHDRAAKRTH